MKKFIKILFLIITGVVCLQAQEDLPDPMDPPRLVNDFAQLFDNVQSRNLEQILRNYQDTTSTQIYVVTVTDLKGYDVADFAVRLGEKWQIGQKDKDNGVLILIKPRVANERGRVFIATGYGVEYILTDARVGRIIDQDMMPYLQGGDYYNATTAAVDRIMSYLSGEFQGDPDEAPAENMYSAIIIILFIIFLFYLSSKGRGGKGPMIGGGLGGFLGGMLGGGRSGGNWGGGGGFGGGFGGGGGGRFGGGGAGRGF